MKKCLTLLLVGLLLAATLAGCLRANPVDTTPSTQPTTEPTVPTTGPTQAPTDDMLIPQGSAKTESARILANIWGTYANDERFAAYGGAVENSVADGPGDLDMTNTEELTARYLLPETHLSAVDEGASLVHLMNNNIFTGVVFHLVDAADTEAVAKALRDNVQSNQWICGQPDHLLIADLDDDHLLMVFGSADAVDTFRGKLTGVYADADMLYDEAILA